MHKGVILRVDAGHGIPDDAVKAILKDHASCMGIALCIENALQLVTVSEGVDLKAVRDTRAAFPDNQMLYHFGSYPAGFMKEDIQPFITLTTDAGDPLMVAAIEGDFSPLAKTEASHSNEFFLLRSILIPKIAQFYRLTGEDLTKTMDALSEPHVAEELMNNCIDRGVISILTANDKAINFSVNDKEGQFSWGWMSQALGYTEKLGRPAGGTPMSAAEQLMAKAKKTVASILPSPTKKENAAARDFQKPVLVGDLHKEKIPPTATVTDKPTVIVDNTKADDGRKYFTPGKDLSRNQLKKEYQRVLGYLPDNWKDKPTVEVIDRKSLKSVGKLPTVASVEPVGPVQPKVAPAPAPAVATAREKVNIRPPAAQPTAPTVAPTSVPEVKPSTTEPMPIIPGQQLQAIVDTWIKNLDANSQVILDVDKIKALEAKLPSFEEQTGYSIIDTLGWSWATRLDLIKKYPEAACVLFTNYGTQLMLALSTASPKKPDVVVEPVHAPVEPTAPEIVEPQKVAASGGGRARVVIRRPAA